MYLLLLFIIVIYIIIHLSLLYIIIYHNIHNLIYIQKFSVEQDSVEKNLIIGNSLDIQRWAV